MGESSEKWNDFWEAVGKVTSSPKGDCPRFFSHCGTIWVAGLFKLHDTHGIPLHLSLAECCRLGYMACLEEFYWDAYLVGWKEEKILGLLASAWNECRLMQLEPAKNEWVKKKLEEAGLLQEAVKA